MAVRLTQLPTEIAAGASGKGRITQLVAETVADVPMVTTCRLTQLAVETIGVGPVQIIGTFVDCEGRPIAGGTISFQLLNPAISVGGNQLSPVSISRTLDSSGSIPTNPPLYLWPNDFMYTAAVYPGIGFYRMRLSTADGEELFTREITVTDIDPFDIGSNWTPLP